MTANERRNFVTDYERSCLIYMNFSIDEDKRVWGLSEGDKSLYYMENEKINKYNNFLDEAIKNYEIMVNYDMEAGKKLKKYKTYKKRIQKAIQTIK